MASLNRVTLIGYLGRDPETRTFANGGKIVNLRLATSESWKDKNTGEKKEKTEWHSISISNEGLARIAEQYLKKGSLVMIEGQLETRKWQDQAGADRYTTEVAVRNFGGLLKMLGGKDGGGRSDDRSSSDSYGGSSSGGGYSNTGRPAGNGTLPGTGYGGHSDMEDDIPF